MTRDPIDYVIESALSTLGVPYIWGGNNPLQGLDCSGAVRWWLRAAGLTPSWDETSQGIYDRLTKHGGRVEPSAQRGYVLFFGKSVLSITHVALALNQFQMIEAAGGNSSCTSRQAASERGAMVQINLIKRRSDLVARVKPDYSQLGLY